MLQLYEFQLIVILIYYNPISIAIPHQVCYINSNSGIEVGIFSLIPNAYRHRCAPELAALLVFGFDVDDDGIDALLQEILHMIQAQLKQTVFVLNTHTHTDRV